MPCSNGFFLVFALTTCLVAATYLSPGGTAEAFSPDGLMAAGSSPARSSISGAVLSPLVLYATKDDNNGDGDAKEDGQAILSFNLSGDDFDAALDQAGAMPLPPYIAARRAADDRDATDYQTVFARQPGAVAAPTASLHFDQALLDRLAATGIEFTKVTLHVGAGTFLPVKVDDVTKHKMHAEWGRIDADTAARIEAARAAGGRIIAVGTTSLRLLESAAAPDGTLGAWEGDTDIFITPGYRFRIVDGLMTNFHLPKSTLMMLVSALMGRERMMVVYEHAIAARYRFYSYGDSSLLIP